MTWICIDSYTNPHHLFPDGGNTSVLDLYKNNTYQEKDLHQNFLTNRENVVTHPKLYHGSVEHPQMESNYGLQKAKRE